MWKEQALIEKYFSGYIELSLEEDYYFLYRFGKKQRDFYNKEMLWFGMMSHCQAGIVLKANQCKKIAFDFVCKTEQEDITFETITNIDKVQRYTFSADEKHAEFLFEEADVLLYFPYNAHLGIRNIEISGTPVEKKERIILCFGDSITQGYSTDEPSQAYPSELARRFDATVYNFGISGYFMKREILNELDSLPNPWMITFAYGTNDWHFEADYKQDLKDVFAILNSKYPTIPIFVLLPIARGCQQEQMKYGTLQDVRNDISMEASKYSNFYVLESGKDMRMGEHFREDETHPNNEGMRCLASKIVRDILRYKEA